MLMVLLVLVLVPDQVRLGFYLEEFLSDGQQNQNRTRSKQKVLP